MPVDGGVSAGVAYPRRVVPILYSAALVLLSIWAAFWVIRLAVRYGMNDALRMNREWLAPTEEREHS